MVSLRASLSLTAGRGLGFLFGRLGFGLLVSCFDLFNDAGYLVQQGAFVPFDVLGPNEGVTPGN